ncbi:MAG TPA: CehA/McbA family metallohydrolase [Gemmatimonadales bacterium]|nr:CehA/McbA family metallohydrolase [Gemmatimonadales bacterium]
MSFVKLTCAALGLLALAPSLAAQRQPVLPQIKVPHSYYYREMYLPQVTSGPSAVTWSPDGRELIYSMQGSLWRQPVGSKVTRQVTSGPGYDYQPDWSPDGRTIVYSSYHDDQIELRVLDLSTGQSRSLLADGGVNVEPRWSPDGRRIAYVSTAYQGRWHIFIAQVSDGSLGSSQRITEDRESGLPRYYYGTHDQYLSPTWSSDGQDLIFISNRGHIWGSGGFWRVPARPNAEPQELRFEETTWKARPDWSRDGKRVVYSSYLGRQWHQLWLMTANGGDPFQLTYGEGDATAPRWSPEGRRIAYITNDRGNTGLSVVDVPGGRIERVVIDRRIYLEPVGRLQLVVTDRAGRLSPARISITGPDGRSYAPDNAWRHADDGYDRSVRRFEYGYFHTSGVATVTVPAGAISLEISHGPEYRVVRRTLNVVPNSTRGVRVALERLADLPAAGWYSGDLHVHMNYGGAYRNTPRRLAAQARAEDLHLVENLIVNKEGRIPDLQYFTGHPDPVSTPGTVIVHDQEYHTSYWGHAGLLGLRHNIVLPGYSGYVNTAAASLYPTNAAVMDLAHAQGGVTGYVHPFDGYPEPSDTTKPLTNELPVDVALGKVDYYEALGFVDDYMATARVWYQLLNCGFRLPAGAGTDAMANFASLRGPVGMNRVFVKSGAPLEHRRWLAALKVGRSFATNGPLLSLTLNGRELGDQLKLPVGGGELTARVSLRSIVPVDHLEIVGNGKVVAEIPLGGNRTTLSTMLKIPVQGSGWYLLRARGDRPAYPILDVYPYATTSPIYVTVGGTKVRSPADAEYFIAWIDRLRTGVEANRDWNSEEEKSEVLTTLQRAREEFTQLSR